MRTLTAIAVITASASLTLLGFTANGAEAGDPVSTNNWTGELRVHPDGLGVTAITQINSVAAPTTHVVFDVLVDGQPVAEYPQSGDTTQAAYIAYRLTKGTGKHVVTVSDGSSVLDRVVVRTGSKKAHAQ